MAHLIFFQVLFIASLLSCLYRRSVNAEAESNSHHDHHGHRRSVEIRTSLESPVPKTPEVDFVSNSSQGIKEFLAEVSSPALLEKGTTSTRCTVGPNLGNLLCVVTYDVIRLVQALEVALDCTLQELTIRLVLNVNVNLNLIRQLIANLHISILVIARDEDLPKGETGLISDIKCTTCNNHISISALVTFVQNLLNCNIITLRGATIPILQSYCHICLCCVL